MAGTCGATRRLRMSFLVASGPEATATTKSWLRPPSPESKPLRERTHCLSVVRRNARAGPAQAGANRTPCTDFMGRRTKSNVSPIGSGQISLTKHYRLDALVQELAQIKPGMSEAGAGNVLSSGGHAHAELKDDLFIYDNGRIRDDTMLQACRNGDQAAPLLVWAALILADARLAETVEKHLTSPSGKLDPAKFSVDAL